ncbi:hypothetical protein MNEG_11799 [Monoraphidium neglectum]|uniref:Uncharacterized protein n=1 Tax=Monoraphidium neglectum TaxID=145388 RepID=A0A0D2J8W9_9CHLO|nr:hypothetical protein MNEG_11799 [Monoraphidium neglectum]KIY96162.1 hypothetical protein MNEG_11799 [Monoraphidium neglectum]|eukprot:XP_013895182.1 hypothetical protein MNEG_11799 [Monoraphidium neglectum]
MRNNKGRSTSDDDEEWLGGDDGGYRSGGSSHGNAQRVRRAAVQQTARAGSNAGRSRPTNNQLLYKAYFRWNHYSFKLRNGTQHLPTETDACASPARRRRARATSEGAARRGAAREADFARLMAPLQAPSLYLAPPRVAHGRPQVLHTLHVAESCRIAERRNILQILSNNTRRTKVVELTTGTHRVPDELRKHYLSDGEAGQYSTNLDRNRYGNDDQYLFTVIRYDLEYLGLCPCMVDVEIIDAKNDNQPFEITPAAPAASRPQSIFVSAGPEACSCHKVWPHGVAGGMGGGMRGAVPPQAQQAFGMRPGLPFMAGALPGLQQMGLGMPPMGMGAMGQIMGAALQQHHAAAVAAAAAAAQQQPSSPRRSNSGVSHAFDALVMAATGETEEEGGEAGAGDGEQPQVDRRGRGRCRGS